MEDKEILASILEQVRNACELVKLLDAEHQHEAIHEINMIVLRLEEDGA